MLRASPQPALHSTKFTEARAEFSVLFDEAVNDAKPVLIVRGQREHGMLISRDTIRRLLAPFRLHVDVLPEDEGGFTLWLRELDIGATAPTLQAARRELLSVIVDYVRDYWQQFALYRHLADMAAKEPYVLRLSLAQTESELMALLFGADPPTQTPTPKLNAFPA
ncbi:MAG: hypothetical protein E6I52_27060 [Chloroflexi bacterium]|nr:MAG: hypothetical protein E6I52_27060 [Chloroflexota bacterium]